MPLLLLTLLALTAGLIAGVLAWRYPRRRTTGNAAVETARKVGEAVGSHRALRPLIDARLDPEAATGLALTLALVVVIGGGLLFGVLAYLVRTNAHLLGIDNGVAKWAIRN